MINRHQEIWIVIKSNRKIGRLLVSKLKKDTNLTVFKELNTISALDLNMNLKKVVEVLNHYKKQKFEIVRFTDKQFGATVIKRGYCHDYVKRVQSLPLSHTFMWHNDNREGIQAVTPITLRQFNNIVKIN